MTGSRTMANMRTVIVVGLRAPYTDPLLPGEEIWCINKAIANQDNASRVYAMDPMSRFLFSATRRQEFMAAMSRAPRVYLQEPAPEIPQSRAYPLAEVLGAFGVAYFTSTAAYVVAHALLERVDRIILHRLLCLPDSLDYLEQRACLEHWVGRALGMGIQVEITADSHLCRPAPWQPALYGFNDYLDPDYCGKMLAGAAQIGLNIPVRFGESPIADPLVAEMEPAIKRRHVPATPQQVGP